MWKERVQQQTNKVSEMQQKVWRKRECVGEACSETLFRTGCYRWVGRGKKCAVAQPQNCWLLGCVVGLSWRRCSDLYTMYPLSLPQLS